MSKIDIKYYPYLKLVSVSLVLSNLFIHSPTIAIIGFVIAFQTTSIAYQLVKHIEKLFDYTLGKEVQPNEN